MEGNDVGEAKEDRRVKRTKATLKRSLLGLLRKQPLNSITTSELCRAADINRNTFYAHYKSPIDVFEHIQEEYIQVMRESMSAIGHGSLYDETCALLNATKGNAELTLILANNQRNAHSVSEELWSLSHDLWFAEWEKRGVDLPEDVKERTFVFAANGYTAVLLSWVRSGMRESVEAVARAMTDMAMGAIDAGLRS